MPFLETVYKAWAAPVLTVAAAAGGEAPFQGLPKIIVPERENSPSPQRLIAAAAIAAFRRCKVKKRAAATFPIGGEPSMHALIMAQGR
jgi:hypothetical protein